MELSEQDVPETPPNKGGRPKADIDWEVVDKYAGVAPIRPIARRLGISPATLMAAVKREKKMTWEEYSGHILANSLFGDLEAYLAIWKAAVEKQDAPMLRWLAERKLEGFNPPTKLELSGPEGAPIPIATLVATLSEVELEQRLQRMHELNSRPVRGQLTSGEDITDE